MTVYGVMMALQCFNETDRHGGVMIITQDNIPALRRQDLEIECELLWIKVTLAITKVLFGVFYNPPPSAS